MKNLSLKRYGFLSVCRALVEGGDTPLTMAVDNNHLSTVTLLLAWSVEQIVTMSILMVGLL